MNWSDEEVLVLKFNRFLMRHDLLR